MLCLFWNSARRKYWAIRKGLPKEERIRQFIPEAYLDGNRIAIGVADKTLAIIQKRWFNKRFIYNHWNKFADVELEEGIRHSIISLKFIGGKEMKLMRLKKDEARDLHGFARKYIEKHEAKKIAVGKVCPHCSEVIKYTATICPHCQKEQKK